MKGERLIVFVRSEYRKELSDKKPENLYPQLRWEEKFTDFFKELVIT
jgi:hypothetical protein